MGIGLGRALLRKPDDGVYHGVGDCSGDGDDGADNGDDEDGDYDDVDDEIDDDVDDDQTSRLVQSLHCRQPIQGE